MCQRVVETQYPPTCAIVVRYGTPPCQCVVGHSTLLGVLVCATVMLLSTFWYNGEAGDFGTTFVLQGLNLASGLFRMTSQISRGKFRIHPPDLLYGISGISSKMCGKFRTELKCEVSHAEINASRTPPPFPCGVE